MGRNSAGGLLGTLAVLLFGGMTGLSAPAAVAADFKLTFEERDRYEGRPLGRPGSDLLQVWVDGQKVYENDIQNTGPLWREPVAFRANDPQKVKLAFRLAFRERSTADPEVEIGNLRGYDGRGGEVLLVGHWASSATDPWFILHYWSFAPLPAFRDGFALRRAYGMPPKDNQQYAEWRFEGSLVPAVNLQIRRLYEYPGCYGELGFYDDWKKVGFNPARPKAGERVTVTAKVHNAGARDAQGAKVSLTVDGKLADTKVVDVPAVADVEVSFAWTATEGFHSFLVRAEPQAGVPETRKDDNWLLRVLVVGDAAKAHPYLFFRAADLPKIKERLRNPPPWYASYNRETKSAAAWVDPASKQRMEETSAICAAHNAFLALIEPDFRPLDSETKAPVPQSTAERATQLLKTIWDFSRGWFSDAPCSISHYAQAYDWMASSLSAEDDRDIRARLAKAMAEQVLVTSSGLDTRFEKPEPGEGYYPPRRGGRKNLRDYSQGSYIDACGIVVGALALAGEEGADAWLHFGLNAIDEEILREMTTPDGYYREGSGYMHMAESRTGAACWWALAAIGANPFELWPHVERMHDLLLHDRLPNGWSPPINDHRIIGLPQALYAPLYTTPELRAAARWDWKNQAHTERGVSPDGHFGNLFLLTDTPEADAEPAAPPPWTPTQFLGNYLVFRSDWSPDAAYLCLNTKHFPTSSASHDQNDKNSFLMYAKKAFLAVDCGYGNTAGRALIVTVTGWCRGGGNIFNQNMLVVDGKRPTGTHHSPYTYPNSPFPENTFTTGFLDFGESALSGWFTREVQRDAKPVERRALLDHRRSVLFVHTSADPAFHYFIVADALADRLAEVPHTFDYVLNGNSRKPYLDPQHIGDFVNSPPNEGAVPKADNLVVATEGGALEARWTVANADGKDVVLRAFFAQPAPEKLTTTSGDGWLGYTRPVGRNKYLDAKLEGVRHARFLVVLYPDLLGDAKDDVKLERTGEGATIAFADGRKHLVSLKGEESSAEAELSFAELEPAGRLAACLLARGTALERGGVTINSTGKVDTLALDFRGPKELRGYLSTPKTTLRISPCRAVSAAFGGKPVKLAAEAGGVVLADLEGAGELILKLP